MSDRCYEDVVYSHAIQNDVRETIENEAALASPSLRPPERSFGDALDCVIDFESERLRGNFTALAIPVLCVSKLLISLAMKSDQHQARRNNLARTSSHGMV
jgi:hypothetical protein